MEKSKIYIISTATCKYYEAVCADPALKHIFSNIDVLMLRYHVAFLFNQLNDDHTSLSQQQMLYLIRAHKPIIERHHVDQSHYDKMMKHLETALYACGADQKDIDGLWFKLRPVRDIFPESKVQSPKTKRWKMLTCLMCGGGGDTTESPPVNVDNRLSVHSSKDLPVAEGRRSF